MAKQFEAILVLGCGISENADLTDDARSSVEIASNLFEQRLAPLIIFSGSYSYKADFIPPVGESQVIKDYAISLGVPSSKVLVESESKDALGNAYYTKVNILGPLALKKIAILRGPNHSEERLRFIFGKVLGPWYVYDFIERPEHRAEEQERERKSLAVLKDWLQEIKDGDDEAVYKIMRDRHPGYSSNPNTQEALKRQLDLV